MGAHKGNKTLWTCAHYTSGKYINHSLVVCSVIRLMSSGIIVGFLCGYNTSCCHSVVSTVLEQLAEFHDASVSYLVTVLVVL